ncbi:MAG: lyase, partial [Mailhella sp.]|nr:lyase [Mailhella sp.]
MEEKKRIVKDALGTMEVPEHVYYGAQTARAMQCLDVHDETYVRYPSYVAAFAKVKKACALANMDIGALDPSRAEAICRAADEVIEGRWQENFPLCVFRGSGTPLNMAVNEVIATRANEMLTGHKGQDAVHPNTHVNMCQSSNDVSPTAKMIAVYEELGGVLRSAAVLEASLERKSREFRTAVKMGRTCLQDAIPVTLGQSFGAWTSMVRRNRIRLEEERSRWNRGVLGGTAVGTGMGCMPGFVDRVYVRLSEVCGRPIFKDDDLFDGLQSSDGLVLMHGHLQALAIGVGRIAHDLKLMASGPRAGLGEIVLPAVQPGSSIMPGKINPVIPDMMEQAQQKICANHAGMALAACTGELELGPSSAILVRGFFDSVRLLSSGMRILAERCIDGITYREENCAGVAEASTSLATMVSALFGYDVGTRIAHIA